MFDATLANFLLFWSDKCVVSLASSSAGWSGVETALRLRLLRLAAFVAVSELSGSEVAAFGAILSWAGDGVELC